MHSPSDLTAEESLADQRWLGTEVRSFLPMALREIEDHVWIESEKFAREDFAKLLRPILENDRLVLVIIEMMKADRRKVVSDLEAIEWARDAGVPMERVIEILLDIHINVARLDPPAEWLRAANAHLSS